VLDAATSGGAGVSSQVQQLAGKAAGAKTLSITSSITSLAILMKTKATLVSAAVIALAAIGTTAYVVNRGNDRSEKETQGADHRNLAGQANPGDDRDRKARQREPRFQSVEEAEQALLDFDMTPIYGSDREEAKRCLYRFRSLAARIPEAFYSELAARLGEGADSNLERHFRQMALYQEWGRVDFEAALADLSRIKDERRHSKALHSVFVGATEPDARAAMKRAETLDIETPGELGDAERIDLMDTIFDTWIESDPFSAVEWARQAPAPDKRRDQWIADGLRAWDKKDPDAAGKWRKRENFKGFKP
jgi:hypothetical protein